MKQLLNLVGMFYRPPAAKIVPLLPSGTKVILVREPGNAADPNAVAVWLHLGYVDKQQALEIAERIDMSQDALARIEGTIAVQQSRPQIEVDL